MFAVRRAPTNDDVVKSHAGATLELVLCFLRKQQLGAVGLPLGLDALKLSPECLLKREALEANLEARFPCSLQLIRAACLSE